MSLEPDHTDPNSGAGNALNASHAFLTACVYCGGQFPAKRRWQRFCGDPCRKLFHRSRVGRPVAEQLKALRADLAEVKARLAVLESASQRGGRRGSEVAPSAECLSHIQGDVEGAEGAEGQSRART